MTSSLRTLFLITALFISQGITALASDPYTQAYLKWDAGDYIGALEDFIAILESPDANLYFDDIATLTGELYKVDTVTEDGRNPVFSPDNSHFAWQEETDGEIMINIGRIDDRGIEHLHSIEGSEFLFSPQGRYGVIIRTATTSRTEELQQKLSKAFEARDRSAIVSTRNELQYVNAINSTLYRVDLQSGETSALNTGDLMVRTPAFDTEGTLWFTGADPAEQTHSDIYSISILQPGSTPVKVTGETGFYDAPTPVPGSNLIVFSSYGSSPFPVSSGTERHSIDVPRTVVLHQPGQGDINRWEGEAPVVSRDGSRLAFMRSDNSVAEIYSTAISTDTGEAHQMAASSDPIQHPALSPDGSKLAYMLREGISWDLHMVHTEEGKNERLSFDIQHELFPHFLNNNQVLGMMGESRHRRSHIYDVDTKEFYRLFHNNSVRTVTMEYDWEPSPDGTRLLIVAQRDGNTISPDRGIYLVRIGEKISKQALIDRLQKNLDSERRLLRNAEEMYRPIFDSVKKATQEVNITRLYNYQKSLYDFGSKHITQSGNQKASEYIYETLQSFGYDPEYQWFNPTGEIESANVVARLEGTTHPEVVYILSSHFDSVQRSPGADDNTSGTSVLLETARVLADNPQPATIIFASLTGEEAGLLGAREFVRVARAEGLQAAGVVNNDMMGWTRHHRLDNTIRFSNYGIRDIQHSGAILFSDLITYDSRYYRSTDAHIFFDAYGDVIGGIGSYPILGNPNYHQTTDRLETINHNLVREVARSTTATLMMLANAPSKVTGIEVNDLGDNRIEVAWNPSRENDIDHYRIRYTDISGNEQVIPGSDEQVILRNADSSHPVSVVAVNNRGIQGWDWTRSVKQMNR